MTHPDILEFRNEFRWMSNFWDVGIPIVFVGDDYPTVEHAYQAAKTEDMVERKLIADALSPGAAKRLGAKLNLRPYWGLMRIEIMMSLVSQKFQVEKYKDKLLATDECHIEEGNEWHDMFWGVDLDTRNGHNIMGQIIMKIRHNIQNPNTGFDYCGEI